MSLEIWMVENDTDDRQLTEETFQREWPAAKIDFVYGVDLPVRLRRGGPRPRLILLTMNTRPYSATQMIRQIRETEGFRSIPIIVLSESASPQEIQASYLAGASSYIKKPDNYSEALAKIKSFIHYWFQTVELPVF